MKLLRALFGVTSLQTVLPKVLAGVLPSGLVHMAGKCVLAVGWEPSCTVGAEVGGQVSQHRGFLWGYLSFLQQDDWTSKAGVPGPITTHPLSSDYLHFSHVQNILVPNSLDLLCSLRNWYTPLPLNLGVGRTINYVDK